MSYQAIERHWETVNIHYKWKNPIWSGYILYDFNFGYFRKGKTMEKIKRLKIAKGEQGRNE